MPLQGWFDQAAEQPPSRGGGSVTGAAGVLGLRVSRAQWSQAAEDFARERGRLLSLWAGRDAPGGELLRAAYIAQARVLVVSLPLTAADPPYPGIAHLFPSAGRMQRAVTDLCGLRAENSDSRPWLRHAAWPKDFHPLLDAHSPPTGESAADDYPFVAVQGEGVHEIAVGPVHAGIIEPGHFRFSVVGEKVLRLEERLGYVHKGIERRFTELPLLGGERLAARVSGDSAVAFSWAYCQALEGMVAAYVPARAL
jgi:Ni,Fe-hydrogenase III component G